MEEGLKCLDTAKTKAQNASRTIELAFNISEQTKEVSIIRVLSFFYTKLSPSLVCKLFPNHFLSLIH